MGHANQRGFSLTELMVALTIIGVLIAFALPSYQASIDTTDRGVLTSNMDTIEMFQEDFRLTNGVYSVDHANLAAITAAIGWDPQIEDGVTYSIGAGGGGATNYQLTAVDPDGITICMQYPEKIVCP